MTKKWTNETTSYSLTRLGTWKMGLKAHKCDKILVAPV